MMNHTEGNLYQKCLFSTVFFFLELGFLNALSIEWFTFFKQSSTCSFNSSLVPVTLRLQTGQIVSSCFFFLDLLRAAEHQF